MPVLKMQIEAMIPELHISGRCAAAISEMIARNAEAILKTQIEAMTLKLHLHGLCGI